MEKSLGQIACESWVISHRLHHDCEFIPWEDLTQTDKNDWQISANDVVIAYGLQHRLATSHGKRSKSNDETDQAYSAGILADMVDRWDMDRNAVIALINHLRLLLNG